MFEDTDLPIRIESLLQGVCPVLNSTAHPRVQDKNCNTDLMLEYCCAITEHYTKKQTN